MLKYYRVADGVGKLDTTERGHRAFVESMCGKIAVQEIDKATYAKELKEYWNRQSQPIRTVKNET
jgi:hypothetical protein